MTVKNSSINVNQDVKDRFDEVYNQIQLRHPDLEITQGDVVDRLVDVWWHHERKYRREDNE